MKTLGIIGGLGPMATVYYMELLTKMSDAGSDQEHMDVIVFSKPSIPDRTKYILGISDKNPVPEMVSVGRKLKDNGADVIAIPCMTAHYFYSELADQIGVPIINGVEENVYYIKKAGLTCAGILATDGTIKSRLFQDTLEKHGIRAVFPDSREQKKIMSIIYDNVKAGRKADMPAFNQISAHLFKQGAQVILLACTELSLLKRSYRLPPGYLDVLDVLAQRAVEECGLLKKEYRDLITR